MKFVEFYVSKLTKQRKVKFLDIIQLDTTKIKIE